ncbi:FtsX-like permease family protein [Corynebacterium callunae]|uniref:FtsX-like permease family protein n=1 Tax=Corynebacterium callunae TaxID=1721 RepID=UPI003981F03A
MIKLAFAQLRRRGFRYISLFFAIFAAVALSVGATALTNSLVGSVNDLFAKPYANANLVVTTSAQNSEDFLALQDTIASDPNTHTWAFDQNMSASLQQPDGIYASTMVQSITPGELQWRPLLAGRLPENPGEIAVSAAADAPEIGSTLALSLSSSSKDIPVTVVGTMEAAAQETLSGSYIALATPQAVQQWNKSSVRGEFRISSTDSAATTAAIKAAATATDTTAQIASVQGFVEKLSDTYLGQRDRYFLLLSAFVVVAAAVAFLVVFSAFMVLTGERMREFGLIRAIGASTPQLVGSALVEAGVLGLLAAGLGAPAGVFGARFLATQAHLFGVRIPLDNVQAPPTTMALIAGTGVVLTIVAALPAVLSACRKSTVDSLTAAAVSRCSPLLMGLWLFLALAAGAAGWWALGQVENYAGTRAVALVIAAAAAIIFGLLVGTAVALPPALYGLSRLLGKGAPSVQLGLAFASKQKSRSAALIGVILAGVALSSAVLHGQAQIGGHLVNAAKGMGGTDILVTALDSEMPAGLVDSLSALDGVSMAVAPAAATVDFPQSGSTAVLALGEEEGAQVMRGNDTGAPPQTVVLGRSSGEQANFPVGTATEASINEVSLPVTIEHTDNYFSIVDPGLIARAREQKAAELGVSVDKLPAQPVRNILILLDGDSDQDPQNPTVQAIREVIGQQDGRFAVSEGFSARLNTFALVLRVTTMSTLLAVVALAIAAVGLANTVALTVAERARDRALLRTIGLTSGGQRVVMGTELFALALPAAVIGTVAGGWLGNIVAATATGSQAGALDPQLILYIPAIMVAGAVLCGLLVLGRSKAQ